jgi:hypothetical protein
LADPEVSVATSIRRVTWHRSRLLKETDALSTELRLGMILAGASFRSRVLPPQAILCVRRLRDPKPGAIRLDRPTLPLQWESAVEQSLDELARRAVRAAFQTASEDTPAVWFADRAELLFALAKAALEHSLWRCWWWAALLGPGDRLLSVKQRWREFARDVPAAVEMLHSAGRAAPFLNLLGEEESRLTLAAIFKSYAIDLPLPSTLPKIPQFEVVSRSSMEKHSTGTFASGYAAGLEVPDLAHRPAARVLLEAALHLRRDPVAVRSEVFRSKWRRLLEMAFGGDPEFVQPPDLRTDTAELHALIVAESSAAPLDSISSPTPTSPSDQQNSPQRGRSRTRRGEPPVEADLEISPETSAATAAEQPLVFEAPAHDAQPLADASPSEAQSAPALSSPCASAPAQHTVIERRPVVIEPIATELGGVFFLLNVALHLELYGDFTTPLAPGIALNIWDFIALVGRALSVDTVGDDFFDDAVWPLLAELAGRRRETPPGVAFEPPCEWTIPERWVRAIDLPVTAPPAEADLDAWLAWLMPYIRARLATALGLDSPHRIAEMLLCRPARVFVTPMHVDVVFTLQTHPVEVRFAGLDRDPGWIPAAGRSVRFHFE